MITPKLEQMIWDGRALYKTWTIGTGAAGLNVENNQTIIILAVDYFGFLDTDEPNFSPNAIWYRKMNKQITFYSSKERHSILARSFFSMDNGVQSSHHRYEMYFVFTENIVCNIGTFLPVSQWNIINGKAPNESGQKPPPLGLGNENGGFGSPNVIIEVLFNSSQSNESVIPFPDTRPTKALNSDDWQIAFSTDTQLLTPTQNANNVGEMQYPLMTVHYVVVNERLKAKFA